MEEYCFWQKSFKNRTLFQRSLRVMRDVGGRHCLVGLRGFDVDTNSVFMTLAEDTASSLTQNDVAWVDVERLYICLSDALRFMHKEPHTLVHGDIKPSNILRTEAGDCELTDFDTTVRVGDHPGAFTRFFLRPFRLRDLEKTGDPFAWRLAEHADDWHAFGITLLMCLVHRSDNRTQHTVKAEDWFRLPEIWQARVAELLDDETFQKILMC